MRRRSLSTIPTLLGIVSLAAACSFSPLAHRIKVGEEAFVVFVGEGADHQTDLFAVPASGGEVSQVTFTGLVESRPRITPAGDVVAFLRSTDTLRSTPRDVVLMNLLSGGEAVIPLSPGAGVARDVAWNAAADSLYVRTDSGFWVTPAPPRRMQLTRLGPESAKADSSMGLWLGEPRFALVVGCSTGGLCVRGPHGDTTALAPDGRDAMRWGPDSVAWFQNDLITVRALGPGSARRIAWQRAPSRPREATYARGPTGN